MREAFFIYKNVLLDISSLIRSDLFDICVIIVYNIHVQKNGVILLAIVVSFQSDIPAYEQIKEQIKEQILSGELAADEPLISMRQLARDLRVSMITTTRAYGDLEAEGLIYTVQGRGCYVKGNADMVRTQYLHTIDKSLRIAVEKGKAAGLSLDELHKRLENKFNEQRD